VVVEHKRREAVRQMMRFARELGTWFVDLAVPVRCTGCRAMGAILCVKCEAAVGADAPLKRSGFGSAIDVVALGPYQGPLKAAIHALKFKGARAVGRRLGLLLAAYSARCDVVVPVPLHAKRFRERGYNQAAIIAAAVARSHGVPCADAAVARVRATAQQSALPAAARGANVAGAFVPGAAARHAAGARVLLIDDVATTGATSAACAAALTQAGAREVHLAVAALVL
jgi:ComF family protein